MVDCGKGGYIGFAPHFFPTRLEIVKEVYFRAPVPRGNWARVCCWGHA